jgi:Flp pilus assembly protein TadG
MLAAPVLVIFLYSALDTGIYLSDRITAQHAVRQGARSAAELGGTLTNPGMTQAQLDSAVVTNIQAVASALNFSYIQEIEIYRVSAYDGSLQPGDLQDKFDGNGTAVGTQTFTLDQRREIPPTETVLGVRMVWVYNPPTGISFTSLTTTDYAVFRVSPWRVG